MAAGCITYHIGGGGRTRHIFNYALPSWAYVVFSFAFLLLAQFFTEEESSIFYVIWLFLKKPGRNVVPAGPQKNPFSFAQSSSIPPKKCSFVEGNQTKVELASRRVTRDEERKEFRSSIFPHLLSGERKKNKKDEKPSLPPKSQLLLCCCGGSREGGGDKKGGGREKEEEIPRSLPLPPSFLPFLSRVQRPLEYIHGMRSAGAGGSRNGLHGGPLTRHPRFFPESRRRNCCQN